MVSILETRTKRCKTPSLQQLSRRCARSQYMCPEARLRPQKRTPAKTRGVQAQAQPMRTCSVAQGEPLAYRNLRQVDLLK